MRDLVTNDTVLTWLAEIRNLTLGAENANATTANTIQYFIDHINGAGVQATISLQNQLVSALDHVGYKYGCLADKLHAINIVLKDCKDGDDAFDTLYKEVAEDQNR